MSRYEIESFSDEEINDPCWCVEMQDLPVQPCPTCDGKRELYRFPNLDYWLIGGSWDGAVTGWTEPAETEPTIKKPWWKLWSDPPVFKPRPEVPESVLMGRNICQVSDLPEGITPCSVVLPEGGLAKDYDMGQTLEEQGKLWQTVWPAIKTQFADHVAVAIDTHR